MMLVMFKVIISFHIQYMYFSKLKKKSADEVIALKSWYLLKKVLIKFLSSSYAK